MSRGQGEPSPPQFRHTALPVFQSGGRFDMELSIIDLLQLVAVICTCLGVLFFSIRF